MMESKIDKYPEIEAYMDSLLAETETLSHSKEEALEAFSRAKRKLGLTVQSKRRTYLKRMAYFGFSILFAAALSSIYFLSQKLNEIKTTAWQECIVPAGQTKEIMLPDGSDIVVNSGSHIIFPNRFSGKTREIFLDGELLADIAKDEKKPFIIHSGNLDIKVLGTKFNFKSYSQSECVEVMLLSGSVDFTSTNDSIPRTVRMQPNDLLQYNRKTKCVEVKFFNVENYISYKENGTIHFFNVPMKDIAKDLESMFDVKIMITDSMLADKKIYAFFSNHESVDEILSALNADKKIKISHEGGVIKLASKIN